MSELLYTPVIIQFAVPVLDEDHQPCLSKEGIWLEIIPPDQLNSGDQLILSGVVWKQVPSTGALRLKLLPSKVFPTLGRYRVRYHRNPARNRHWKEEEWIVPEAPQLTTATITASGGLDYLGDDLVFELQSVSRSGDYELQGNSLRWISNPPTAGEVYQVVLQPAIPGAQLIANPLPRLSIQQIPGVYPPTF